MVTDFTHTCGLMRVKAVKGSDQVYLVRVYRAAPGAKALPFGHAFGMWFWDDARRRLNPPVGTQQRWDDWAPNAFPFPGPGDHYHGLREWFRTGLPASELTDPTTAPDPACEPPMLLVRYTDHSLEVPDTVEIDIDKARGLILLADLGAGIAHLGTQDASLTNNGVVNTTTQDIGGVKTFWSEIVQRQAAYPLSQATATLHASTPGSGADTDWKVILSQGATEYGRAIVKYNVFGSQFVLEVFPGVSTSAAGVRVGNGSATPYLHLHGPDAVIQMGSAVGLTTNLPAVNPIPGVTLQGGVVVGGSLTPPSPTQAYIFSGYEGP